MALIPIMRSSSSSTIITPLKIIRSSSTISNVSARARLLSTTAGVQETADHFNDGHGIVYKSPKLSSYPYSYCFSKRNFCKSSHLSVDPPAVLWKKFGFGNFTPLLRGNCGGLNSQQYVSACSIHSSPSVFESSHGSSRGSERWLPSIMPFPPVMWPRFINGIRNWFFTHFVIRPYFDRDFDIREFDRGAREAVSFVSNKLSSGEFDALEGLVEASALEEIKKTVSTFSLFQRDLIKVAVEDVFFSFPYQIGVIIPDSPSEEPTSDRYVERSAPAKPAQVRHVEITVVMHVLRGYADKQKSEEHKSFMEFVQDDETKYNVMVCNYRFFRDFTEGCKDPSWIINMVNHFLPADIQRIQKRL